MPEKERTVRPLEDRGEDDTKRPHWSEGPTASELVFKVMTKLWSPDVPQDTLTKRTRELIELCWSQANWSQANPSDAPFDCLVLAAASFLQGHKYEKAVKEALAIWDASHAAIGEEEKIRYLQSIRRSLANADQGPLKPTLSFRQMVLRVAGGRGHDRRWDRALPKYRVFLYRCWGGEVTKENMKQGYATVWSQLPSGDRAYQKAVSALKQQKFMLFSEIEVIAASQLFARFWREHRTIIARSNAEKIER
jgi:hypothetical protein